MNDKDTGGPAFPVPLSEHLNWRDSKLHGMTLRDYFAAKAMQGSLSKDDNVIDAGKFSAWCYEMADAMLKERQA